MHSHGQRHERPADPLGLDENEITRRKDFCELRDGDVTRLKELSRLMQASDQDDFFVEAFYAHLLDFPETASFLRDPTLLRRLKTVHRDYFRSLFEGHYEEDYFHRRLRIGAVHAEIGLPQKWYLGAYRKYIEMLIPQTLRLYRGDHERAHAAVQSALKVIFLDIGLAMDAYIELREERIRDASRKISALSDISLSAGPGNTLADVVEKVMVHGQSLVGASAACAGVFNVDEDRFESIAQVDMTDDMAARLFETESGTAREAIRTGQVTKSTVARCVEEAVARELRALDLGSFICLPFVNSGHPESVICILFFRDEDAEAQSLELLHTFSALSQQAINNAIHYREATSQAHTDSLTGIANRRAFRQLLSVEWKRHCAGNRDLSLVMADIDRFKSINDTYGHGAGDRILREIARRLRGQCRDADFIARYGGEEFTVLLPATDATAACAIAERLREAVAYPGFPAVPGEPLEITISLGVASSPHCEGDMDDLVSNADRALYAAKHEGRNRVVLYE